MNKKLCAHKGVFQRIHRNTHFFSHLDISRWDQFTLEEKKKCLDWRFFL